MKKITLLITTILIVTINSASAQEGRSQSSTDLRERTLFGVKAGANYSKLYSAQGEPFQSSNKLGLAMGVFLAIPIGKYFGIQPEMLFSQKGLKAQGTITGNTYNITRTSNYFDFPLLFSFKPSEFVTVLAGPQYSHLTREKNVFANATTGIEQESAFGNESSRKNTLCFTGGIDITVRHTVLGARIGWDLMNNNTGVSSTTLRYKIMWYQVTIGYRFYKQQNRRRI